MHRRRRGRSAPRGARRREHLAPPPSHLAPTVKGKRDSPTPNPVSGPSTGPPCEYIHNRSRGSAGAPGFGGAAGTSTAHWRLTEMRFKGLALVASAFAFAACGGGDNNSDTAVAAETDAPAT